MEPMDGLRRAIDLSGKAQRDVSVGAGKSPTFLSMTLARGSLPKIDTYSALARACGYKVYLESDTDRIEID